MALAIICHIPLGLILFFLLLGALERFGFLCLGRKFVAEGALPEVRPLVCVQLAMYNEYAVAERITPPRVRCAGRASSSRCRY